MLLTLDIGNTSTTIGLFDGNNLVETWSIASEKHRSLPPAGQRAPGGQSPIQRRGGPPP